MALHLNLYHEVQKQKALQRRDPLKFAVAGLAAVGVACAGYYLLQLNTQRTLSNDLKKLEAEYASLKPKAESAKKRSEELDTTIKLSEMLVKRMEGRFYWAPVLANIVQAVPREVQVTKLTGEVTGEELKRCVLTIDGIAAGEDPRKVAEELRRTLAEQFSEKYKSVTSTFRALEDAQDSVVLNGQKLPAATFAINVTMQSGEEPAPQPVTPRTAKKEKS